MSFLCPLDWHTFFPGGFDNFNANQDTLMVMQGIMLNTKIGPQSITNKGKIVNLYVHANQVQIDLAREAFQKKK